MSGAFSGRSSLVFCSKEEIVDHLLEKVLTNKNRKIGTEWEMFFVDNGGHPITRENGQKAFIEFQKVFSNHGYTTHFLHEKMGDGKNKIVGLHIEELGAISLEAGHQFEFAASVSRNCDEVAEKNDAAYKVIQEVARRLNHGVIFTGHLPGYAEKTEGVDRSRGLQWREYYLKRWGKEALKVREAQDGTASVQVTIDSGAEKFHEFFKTLLLVEPALTLHYANSNRSNVGVAAYSRLIPTQVEPLVGVWQAQTPKQALNVIVDRLLQIEVPFLPDPDRPEIYKAEPLDAARRPPTVKDLMDQGRLNEGVLNNIGGFLYTRPAMRNFMHGLIEMRGVDSQGKPEDVTGVALRVEAVVYNDYAREKLLDDYAHLTPNNLRAFHLAATMTDRTAARNTTVAGRHVSTFVDDIVTRTQTPVRSTPAIRGRVPGYNVACEK